MSSAGLMIAAAGSGSGKTFITCGLLRLLSRKGLRVHGFKCGPDYIDPMFHSRILGISSRNLDPYFYDEETLAFLYERWEDQRDIAVVEGVMGYYDGIGGAAGRGSSYELASILKLPVLLVVSCRGMSASAAAIVKGFTEFQKPSGIAGVILNQISDKVYGDVKALIEAHCGIPVLGYVPMNKAFSVESRHLGLVTPDQITNLQARVDALADGMEETLDVPGLLEIASGASGGHKGRKHGNPLLSRALASMGLQQSDLCHKQVKIAIARDEAFCFLYQDNLDLLRELGAELQFFSPLRDAKIPDGAQAMVLPGGYPELYAEQLSRNRIMLDSIKKAVESGIPTLAECGGFLYLHEQLEDDRGHSFPMAGVIRGKAYRTGRLGRFGYIEVAAKKDQLLLDAGESIRAHEFHYWDSEACGEDCHAVKASGRQEWDCVHGMGHLHAGFPHICFYANPRTAVRLVLRAAEFADQV